MWALMGCEGVLLKIIYGSFNLCVWSNNALTDLLSYEFSFSGRREQRLICSGLLVAMRESGFIPQRGGFYHSVRALLVFNYHANCELRTKIKGSRQFHQQNMMQSPWQSVPDLSTLLSPLLSSPRSLVTSPTLDIYRLLFTPFKISDETAEFFDAGWSIRSNLISFPARYIWTLGQDPLASP